MNLQGQSGQPNTKSFSWWEGTSVNLAHLHILSGESNTRLENSNLFTCHASRSKPMSNNPSLDLNHHVPLIGSCSLVAHHVPQHILQSVGSIYNLEGYHIAGCTLKDVLFNIHLWSLSQVKVNLFFESISCYVTSFQIVYWANRLQKMLGNMVSN